MKHRHLVEDVGLSTAAIDDILERGRPDDWRDLWAAVLADPWGSVAEDVLQICRDHYMYGTSLLWPEMISQLREERRGAS
jgi:hypothetical protein